MFLLLCAFTPGMVNGQAVLYKQNFEDTASLFKGYVLSKFDQGIPANTIWSALKDSAWVVRSIPGESTHAAVATSDYNPAVAADVWFITPVVRLGKASKLSFRSISLTAGKTDTYQVYISTAGQSAGECLFNLPLSDYSSSQATAFETHEINLASAGYSNQPVYIGFRLNTIQGGDKLAIDDIQVNDDSLQSLASLRFTVDMSKYITLGKFHARTDTVDIAGNFNAWDGTQNILSLVPGSDSSKYTVTIPGFHDGDQLEFKFRINSTWNDTSLEFPYGGPNRLWTVQHDRYIYSAFYNEEGTVTAIPGFNNALSAVNIYPNPAGNEFSLLSPKGITRILMTTISGSRVREWNNPGNSVLTVGTADLPRGIYILLFYSGQGIASRKLVLQ